MQFRRWATNVLKEFSKKVYIIDKKRMENGTFFDEDYYDSLLAEKALVEFEKYRVIQDKLYQSDFDKLIESSNK